MYTAWKFPNVCKYVRDKCPNNNCVNRSNYFQYSPGLNLLKKSIFLFEVGILHESNYCLYKCLGFEEENADHEVKDIFPYNKLLAK